MKVKKILTKKNAGEIVELSADEKIQPTLQDGLISHDRYKGKTHIWIKEVRSEPAKVFPKGEPLNGRWANNVYRASGVCTAHRRDLASDCLLTPAKLRFDLSFEDCLDSMGQPDTKVTSLKLEDA